MQTTQGALTRRAPKQERSRQTVDAMLEAVGVVARRHGVRAITTNRIAEAAGVSVGSLYQYFPDKHAIFAALYDRHVDEVRRVIEQTTADCASAPLEDFARELVLGLVDAHAEMADVHDVVASAFPQSAVGFKIALHQAFGEALSRVDDADRFSREETVRMLFVLPRMVETLVHGGAGVPLSRDGVRSETIRAVLAYVNSVQNCTTETTTRSR